MNVLAPWIAKELTTADYCAVYISEMARAWPNETTREQEMIAFAKSNGWRLGFYRSGVVAIFMKENASQRN